MSRGLRLTFALIIFTLCGVASLGLGVWFLAGGVGPLKAVDSQGTPIWLLGAASIPSSLLFLAFAGWLLVIMRRDRQSWSAVHGSDLGTI